MNTVILHHPEGDKKLSLEQLTDFMHQPIDSDNDHLISIGKETRTMSNWQSDKNWVEALSLDDKTVVLIKRKRFGQMKFRDFLSRMYRNEISVEKLVTSTSNSIVSTANFAYRFSAATAVEGIAWATARAGNRVRTTFSSTTQNLKHKTKPTTAN
jgi:hypothetical protein